MSNLQTQISQVSEEQINALFEEGEPLKNIDENDLNLGKSQVRVEKDEKFQEGKNPFVKRDADIPFVDFEALEDTPEEKEDKKGKTKDIKGKKEEEETEEVDEEKENKDKKPKAKEKEVSATEEKETKEKVTKKADTKVENVETDVKEVLKNTVNYMIEQGLWRDFEGKEEFLENIDEDAYAELASKQYEAAIKDKLEEEINSTGEYGKAIIEYAKNGGNPDEIIDLFKEQQSVEAVSIEDEDGQKSLVEKYYTEVFDWSKEKVKKYINTLITSDELKNEAEEVQGKYQEHYKTQVLELQEQQKAQKLQQQEQQKKFIQTINAKLTERKDFTEKDRKLIQDAVFRYDKALPDGTKVNAFYQKFAEMQKNPDDYLDLVKFVMDKQGYNEKVKKSDLTKNTEKKWSFIKANAAVDTTKGSRHEERQTEDKNKQELSFSSVLQRY